MIRNHSNFPVNHQNSRSKIGNLAFSNPFQTGRTQIVQQKKPKVQFSGHERGISDPSSNKKINKIKQAKQLLAQRLKEVTSLAYEEEPESHEKQNIQDFKDKHQKDHTKNWDSHMNPISKLTKQPFVRSKTCDELRKQHSQKKQRKRNNSAIKFTSPQINQCERQVKSTGLYSKEIQSGWIQPSEQNRSDNKSSKVETKQFQVDPFGGNMIETFDQDQLKKISSQVTKRKFKGKYASGKKASADLKEEANHVISEIKFPFRINSVFNQDGQGKTPNKFEISMNSDLSSNLLESEKHLSQRKSQRKFTPRLEKFQVLEKRDSQVSSPPPNVNFQKIQLKNKQQRRPSNSKNEVTQNAKQDEDNNFEYSEDEILSQDPFEIHPTQNEKASRAKSSQNQNQLVASLHATNTILQEKLRIKEIEMQELARNHFKLQTELLHSKNMANQNIRYPQSHNLRIQTGSLNHEKYLAKEENENNPLENQNVTHSEYVNQSNQVSSLPSPKFCDGVQEEFARQRYIPVERGMYQRISHQGNQVFTPPTNSRSKFTKKKELFSSDMSQKVSEEFDSEEIFMPTHYDADNNSASRRFIFKKSHFNENNSANLEQKNPKRDSYVYTLGEDPESGVSSQKNIEISQNQSQKPVSGNALSEDMLLEPITQSMSSSDRIDLLSPIKSHSTDRVESTPFRQSFRTSLTKSENRVLDDSVRKFDYFLTPQKDDNTIIKPQEKDDDEGLFEKAFSSLKKQRESLQSTAKKPNQPNNSENQTQGYRYSSLSSRKKLPIDPIIQHAIE